MDSRPTEVGEDSSIQGPGAAVWSQEARRLQTIRGPESRQLGRISFGYICIVLISGASG